MLDQLLKEINDLKEAKSLLDRILIYYDIYDHQVDNERLFKDDLLNKDLRLYTKFNDSE